MKIDVTVSVDASIPVEEAVSKAWALMFSPPKYAGEKGGPGWEAVRHQVLRYIDGLELTAEIERCAKARMPSLVEDVVSNTLTAVIKKRAKALHESGQLTLEP